MNISEWFPPHIFQWIVLPLLIFLSRIMDVSFQTIRIMFVSRGQKLWAPLLGFFEVFIWILVIGQIMQNLDNILCYVAYAAGFGAGTWAGLKIEERLAYGQLLLQIILRSDATHLIESLRRKGFGVTHIHGSGRHGPVHVLMLVLNRSDVSRVVHSIEKHNPRAFYTLQDVRAVSEGIFPVPKGLFRRHFLRQSSVGRRLRFYRRWVMMRKGK